MRYPKQLEEYIQETFRCRVIELCMVLLRVIIVDTDNNRCVCTCRKAKLPFHPFFTFQRRRNLSLSSSGRTVKPWTAKVVAVTSGHRRRLSALLSITNVKLNIELFIQNLREQKAI